MNAPLIPQANPGAAFPLRMKNLYGPLGSTFASILSTKTQEATNMVASCVLRNRKNLGAAFLKPSGA